MLKIIGLLSILLCFGLTACMAPAYKDHGRHSIPQEEINPRDVNFKTSSDYDFIAPKCVFVLNSHNKVNTKIAKVADQALARYLGDKIERVIFPRLTAKIAHKQGYDLSTQKDRMRFSRNQRCDAFAKTELYDLGDDFALIYSQKHIGLKIDLIRIHDDKPLWQASHTVWRADGGLPLSPLSAAGGLAQAAFFSQDDEIMLSMMDDAVRRMMRTLPSAY